ncbi:hypothetical protein J6590_080127 [Homalodisca vitripennis]|nr:hypothetical protein J6590_080127 [Homalodisca vitripennis]
MVKRCKNCHAVLVILPSPPTPVHISSHVTVYEYPIQTEDFVTVVKCKRQNHKVRSRTISLPDHPFLAGTVVRDVHVRGLALCKKRTNKRMRTGATIRGVCKPGYGLLDVRPLHPEGKDQGDRRWEKIHHPEC